MEFEIPSLYAMELHNFIQLNHHAMEDNFWFELVKLGSNMTRMSAYTRSIGLHRLQWNQLIFRQLNQPTIFLCYNIKSNRQRIRLWSEGIP